MQIVRLYDRTREPQGWMQIIQPTEFAAFATLFDSGAVCDADGVPTSSEDASCVIFPTLPDAEAFCRERVAQIPNLRFDILDAAGPRLPPLFTIVHPSRTAALDFSPTKMRRYKYAAIALLGRTSADLVRLGLLRRRAGRAHHARNQCDADRSEAADDELRPSPPNERAVSVSPSTLEASSALSIVPVDYPRRHSVH